MSGGETDVRRPLGDAVLDELRRIAFTDLTDYVEFRAVKTRATGEMRQEYMVKDSKKIDGAPVSEVSIGKDGGVKFKLYDKMKALELLGRSAGVFSPPEDAPEPEPEMSLSEALDLILQAARELTLQGAGEEARGHE